MPEEASEKLLLRVPEAARRLSVCRTTVYAMVNAGELGYIRVGQSIRIPVKVLDDWVSKQELTFAKKEAA